MRSCVAVVPRSSRTDAKGAFGWGASALKVLGSNPGQVTNYHEIAYISRSFGWLIFCFTVICVASYMTQFISCCIPIQQLGTQQVGSYFIRHCLVVIYKQHLD